ncbi:MAG: hypothetical protein ACYC00_13620 [Eubacteriales bacterium]
MKRFTAITLAILMLLSTAVIFSCAEKQTAENTGTTVSDSTAETTEPEINYAPDLPDTNFEGATFSMVSRDDSFHSYAAHTHDLFAEEMTGDLMNDATYERNTRIAEKYNVEFKITTFNEATNEMAPNSAVEKAVKAGSDEFDLLLTHMINGATSAMNGYYLNWNNLPYIDSEKPYWVQGAVVGYSVGDKLLLSLSDMCVSSNDNTHCMLFNKKIHENFQLANIYDIVENNKWTFNTFREMTRNVSSDIDGDGKMTEADQFGYFIGGGSGQLNYLWAGGSQITSKDENNIPYLNMMSERTVAIYDFLYELRFSDDAFYTAAWHLPFAWEFFSADKALFMTTQIGVINDLRNMDTDFGIIPYPKFDEAQEKYGHYVDGHATLMAVPMTVGNTEKVGIVIEALSYDSYKNLVPIYYDTIITNKFTRDEESGAMLDIIYNSRVFDFAYVYDNWNLAFAFSNMLDAKTENFASYYEKKEKVELKQLDKVIALYDELQ